VKTSIFFYPAFSTVVQSDEYRAGLANALKTKNKRKTKWRKGEVFFFIYTEEPWGWLATCLYFFFLSLACCFLRKFEGLWEGLWKGEGGKGLGFLPFDTIWREEGFN